MAEINLSDPWVEQETLGYRRDLALEMVIQSYVDQIGGEIDREHLDATNYFLSQLDLYELENVAALLTQEIEERI